MRGWEVGEEAGCVVLAGLTHLATLVAVGSCLYGPDGFDPLGLQLCFGGDDRLPCLLCRVECPDASQVPLLLVGRFVVDARLELTAGGLLHAARMAVAASLLPGFLALAGGPSAAVPAAVAVISRG